MSKLDSAYCANQRSSATQFISRRPKAVVGQSHVTDWIRCGIEIDCAMDVKRNVFVSIAAHDTSPRAQALYSDRNLPLDDL